LRAHDGTFKKEAKRGLLPGFRIGTGDRGPIFAPLGLLLVEKPECFVVLYGDGHQAFPVEASEYVEPDEVWLLGQVDVVGLDDMDEGDLGVGFGG